VTIDFDNAKADSGKALRRDSATRAQTAMRT
jgi:hypothetical protein